MTSQSIHARLIAAKLAARKAGEVLLRFADQLNGLEVVRKGTNDFVSNADKTAESVILDILQPKFRSDGFVAEESGTSGNPAAEFQWCIDPLDGTSNFLHGAQNWCVSIGLLQNGLPVMGVVYDPTRKELFEGVVGIGARLNSAPVLVSTVGDPASATIGIGHVPRVPIETFCLDTARLLKAGFAFRQVGAGALMLAYVSAGRVDAYFERHMWPWDAVAGLALIRAAGGDHLPYTQAAPGAGGLVLAGGPELVRKTSAIVAGQRAN
jgi:myo-inositol-1(or 4)-monophosphatase